MESNRPMIDENAAVPDADSAEQRRSDEALRQADERNDAELDAAQATLDEHAREGGADPGSAGR